MCWFGYLMYVCVCVIKVLFIYIVARRLILREETDQLIPHLIVRIWKSEHLSWVSGHKQN